MEFRKHCVIDQNKKFVRVLDADTPNVETVYTVPPRILEYTEAYWMDPGWDIRRNNELLNQITTNQVSSISAKSVAVKNLAEESRRPILEARKNAISKVNENLEERFEIRLEQLKQTIMFYYEKYDIPDFYREYKSILEKYLEKSKNKEFTEEDIFLVEIELTPPDLNVIPREIEYSEEENLDDIIENPEVASENIAHFEIEYQYDYLKMFPDLWPFELGTSLAQNPFEIDLLVNNGALITHTHIEEQPSE